VVSNLIDISKKYLIVLPVNGYMNRIQAIVSGWLLATQLNYEFKVYWVPEKNAPSNVDDIFNADFLQNYFIDSNQWKIFSTLGPNNFPKYLTFLNGDVFIQGLDKGEQKFIQRMVNVEIKNHTRNIYIKGGSNFYATIFNDFTSFQISKKNLFHVNLFSADLLVDFNKFKSILPSNYIGLHLRSTDRIFEFPPDKKLLRKILEISVLIDTRDVFIATDNPIVLEKWSELLRHNGLIVHAQTNITYDRTNLGSAKSALLDWLALVNCTSLIQTGFSTFSEEAFVYSESISSKSNIKNNPIKILVYRSFRWLKTKIYVKFLA
jgi:hypothetical protein